MRVIQETDYVTLDIWDLTITSVSLVGVGGGELAYTVTSPNPDMGSVLTIDLNMTYPVSSTVEIQVFYST